MGVDLLIKAHVEGPLLRKSKMLCEVWVGDVLTLKAETIFVQVDTGQFSAKARGQKI